MQQPPPGYVAYPPVQPFGAPSAPSASYTMTVGVVSITYAFGPDTLDVTTTGPFGKQVSIPYRSIVAFGVGVGQFGTLMLATVDPPAKKPKLRSFNVDLGNLATRDVIASLQARVPAAFRGQMEALAMRKALGFSNAVLFLTVMGIILGIVAVGGIVAALTQP